jgi:hypothetical protein
LQVAEDQEVTTPKKRCVQTSVQTRPENGAKTGKIDTPRLSADLAEIVAVWADLPEHIKTAIKALVQTHIRTGT